MATIAKSSLQRRLRRALSSLFREAWRLQHRRRRRCAAAVLVGCGIACAGGLLIANDQGGASTRPGGRPIPLVTSLALPKAGDYFALAVVGARVVVSGGPEGSLFPSGSTTSLSHGRALGTCDAATVDPGTLKLAHAAHANCGDPALYGERVLAVSYFAQPVSGAQGLGEFAVRIAHVDRGARDGYTLGPIVMTYPQCSDCSAQWIYGDGSLWLYDAYNVSLSRPRGELLRVSDATGKVMQRWVIPQNPRELLAVDADGLWFAPSVEGGEPPRTSAPQMARYESLYRVTPGARAPRRAFKIGAGGARWLVASGHTVWLAANWSQNKSTLWRLQGREATPTFHGVYPPDTDQGADIGEAAPSHAGNAAIGIYYVTNPGFGTATSATQQVFRLPPNAAKQQTVATVPAPPDVDSYGPQPPAVALGRSFYFLDPPLLSYPGGNRPPIVRGRAVLYRVTPRGSKPPR
jgi:hypothetical protein